MYVFINCDVVKYLLPGCLPDKQHYHWLKHCLSLSLFFDILKIVQSDRGTNFTSKMFGEIWKLFQVKNAQSTSYHSKSQVAFERFHQTLNFLLCAYCTNLDRDWDEGLPWLMLAAQEINQASTGFSPNELVFGPTVWGSLAVL